MNALPTFKIPDSIKPIFQAFKASGYQCFLTGGSVRDLVLNRPVHDYDFSTNANTKQIAEICHKAKWKAIPTGVDHGTTTIVTDFGSFETTTFRSDFDHDGRHAKIKTAGVTIEEDAARRDFTVNAMYLDQDGKLYDFHHGLQDCKNQMLRFVGKPDERIIEDHLRILRLFRFSSQLGFTMEAESLRVSLKHADKLATLSRERIGQEWIKLVKGPHRKRVFEFVCGPIGEFISTTFGAFGEKRLLQVLHLLQSDNHWLWLVVGWKSWFEGDLVIETKNLTKAADQLALDLRLSGQDKSVLKSIACLPKVLKCDYKNIGEVLLHIEDSSYAHSQLSAKNMGNISMNVLSSIMDARKQLHIQGPDDHKWFEIVDVWSTYQDRIDLRTPVGGDDLEKAMPDLAKNQYGTTLREIRKNFLNSPFSKEDWYQKN
jgi:tRNA nucleotidyltransferase/poly(A) polymerase